jgi:hypothetical protein
VPEPSGSPLRGHANRPEPRYLSSGRARAGWRIGRPQTHRAKRRQQNVFWLRQFEPTTISTTAKLYRATIKRQDCLRTSLGDPIYRPSVNFDETPPVKGAQFHGRCRRLQWSPYQHWQSRWVADLTCAQVISRQTPGYSVAFPVPAVLLIDPSILSNWATSPHRSVERPAGRELSMRRKTKKIYRKLLTRSRTWSHPRVAG